MWRNFLGSLNRILNPIPFCLWVRDFGPRFETFNKVDGFLYHVCGLSQMADLFFRLVAGEAAIGFI